MPLIFYIHGRFGSTFGDKVMQLKDHYGESVVIPLAYDPESPLTAQLTLISKIDDSLTHTEDPRFMIVGSSIGAFWAARIAYHYGCPSVLINPCYDPVKMINSQINELIKPLSKPISSDYDHHFFDLLIEQQVDILLANHDELFAPFWPNLREACPHCCFTHDSTSTHYECLSILSSITNSTLLPSFSAY